MQCLSPIQIKNESPKALRLYGPRMTVPCGRCAACIDNKRKSWLVRLKQERKYAFNAFFVTLTYADSFLPRNSLGFPTFKIKDVQDFMKRLRKELSVIQKDCPHPLHLRYFLIGEYGSKRGRPHYHAIFFNIPPNVDLYRLIFNKWKFGRISVSPLCEAQIGYCANYMYGKCEQIPYEYIDESNRLPVLTSRKPGIGAHYLTGEVIDWHLKGLRSYYQEGDIRYPLPRYYKDKIFVGFIDKEKLYKQNYARILEKELEEYFEDSAYVDAGGDINTLPSQMKKREYIRRFYQRVKKHCEQNLNSKQDEYI